MSVKTRRDENAEATRAALVAEARRLFVERGYAATSVDEIARATRVTKGALYHHFKDKQTLFQAVAEDAASELAARIRSAGDAGADAWDQLRLSCHAYLDACIDGDAQRLLALDVPSVLGWTQWCILDRSHVQGVFEDRLAATMDAGTIEQQPVQDLARLLLGTLDVGSRVIAASSDPAASREQTGATIERFLAGIRSS